MQDDDPTGVAAHLGTTHKHVVASTLTDPDWRNGTILRGPIADDVSALESGEGEHIVVTGSIQLTHALIAAGLVDEYRLFVYPTVAGRGRRLSPEGTELPRLTLEEQTPLRSGVVLLTDTARVTARVAGHRSRPARTLDAARASRPARRYLRPRGPTRPYSGRDGPAVDRVVERVALL